MPFAFKCRRCRLFKKSRAASRDLRIKHCGKCSREMREERQSRK